MAKRKLIKAQSREQALAIAYSKCRASGRAQDCTKWIAGEMSHKKHGKKSPAGKRAAPRLGRKKK